MTLKFSVDAFQSEVDSYCKLVVKKNKKIMHTIQKCTQGTYDFDMDVNEHTIIDLVISNKNPKHSIVKDGKIIKDTYLQIKSIKLNDQEILDRVNLFSNYFTEKNGVCKTNGFLTFNGTFTMKIRHPLSTHLLYCDYYTPKN